MASEPTAAERHRFEASQNRNTFSFAKKPVLAIKPGDRVISETTDVRRLDAEDQQVDDRKKP